MADYSKQYCELNDMGFNGDFDVYEEWSKLTPGYIVGIICEGFGFTAICRPEKEDKVLVFVPVSTMDSGEWVDFDEMCLKAKQQS